MNELTPAQVAAVRQICESGYIGVGSLASEAWRAGRNFRYSADIQWPQSIREAIAKGNSDPGNSLDVGLRDAERQRVDIMLMIDHVNLTLTAKTLELAERIKQLEPSNE